MENPNKLLLKAIYNQVVKLYQSCAICIFIVRHSKIMKDHSFMFHKSLGQHIYIYIFFTYALFYIYILKYTLFFSIIWNFKINIVTKNGKFWNIYFSNFRSFLTADATLQVTCLFFNHVISEIPLKGTQSFFVPTRSYFKNPDLKELEYRN